MVSSQTMTANHTSVKNYTAEVVVYGVILSENPIQPGSCYYRPERIDRIEHENELQKERASVILLQNLERIVQEKGYQIKKTELEDYDYYGVKSPVVRLPLNGNIVLGQLVIDPGSQGGWCGGVENHTSLYVELKSNAKLELGVACDHFKQLTETAEGLVDKLVEEYKTVDSEVFGLFYFKGMGLKIPKNDPLRALFVPKDETGISKQILDRYEIDQEVKIVLDDLARIHGERGKGKIKGLKLYNEKLGGIISYYGERRWRIHSSVLDDRLTWTGFSDIPSSDKLSELLIQARVKRLTIRNSFPPFRIDWGLSNS